jgi:hypothetical protein
MTHHTRLGNPRVKIRNRLTNALRAPKPRLWEKMIDEFGKQPFAQSIILTTDLRVPGENRYWKRIAVIELIRMRHAGWIGRLASQAIVDGDLEKAQGLLSRWRGVRKFGFDGRWLLSYWPKWASENPDAAEFWREHSGEYINKALKDAIMNPTPSAARVAHAFIAAKYGIEMAVGDVVKLRSRGGIQATVTDVTHNYRARKFPYVVKFTDDEGRDYSGKRTSIRYDAPENSRLLEYVGRSRAKKKIQDSNKREQDRADQKQDKAEAGVKALRTWKLNPGDVILYKYRNGRHQEIVGNVNHRTGKVGIERFTPSQKAEYLQGLRDQQETSELMRILFDIGAYSRRKRPDRSLRWLPADAIVEVVKRAN